MIKRFDIFWKRAHNLFSLQKQITSYRYKIDIENQLIFRAQSASGFAANFFILYSTEVPNKGFIANCSFVKCFAQSLELFDGTKSFLFTLIVLNLRRLPSDHVGRGSI
jgi:hypothetical protein